MSNCYKTKYLINNYKRLDSGAIKALSANISWFNLSCFEKLDVEFIEKFKDKIIWEIYSNNRFITTDIVLKYHEYLNIPQVLSNNRIDEKCILDNINIFIKYLPYILINGDYLSKDCYNKLLILYELNK